MRLGIIGCGPSAVALIVGLSCEGAADLDVVIFERDYPLYSDFLRSDDDAIITNTSAGITSIVPGKENDLVDWLGTAAPSLAQSTSFVPRHLYRRYLSERLSQACDRLKRQGGTIKIVRANVEGVNTLGDGRLRILASGLAEDVHTLVVATGAQSKVVGVPDVEAAQIVQGPYADPGFLTNGRPGGSALILGTKLSAIDAALLFLKHRPDMQVTMASRSGILPAVRNELLRYQPLCYTIDRWEQTAGSDRVRTLGRLAVRELQRKQNPARRPREIRGVLGQLQYEIDLCQNGWNQWQFAIAHLIEETNEVWNRLSTDEQHRLKQLAAGFISRYVSSFPLENAQKIAAAMKQGRLAVKSIEAADAQRALGSFDTIVNCTGLDTVAYRREPLWRDLASLGCRMNAHGGMAADAKSMQLLTAANQHRIYGMGAPINGSLLVTNYVRASVKQAEAIASDLRNQLRSQYVSRKAA